MLTDQERQDYLAQLNHQPVYKRLQVLERLADALRYHLHIDEGGTLDLVPVGWPLRETAQAFCFNDAGIAAALAWLIAQAGGARSPPRR